MTKDYAKQRPTSSQVRSKRKVETKSSFLPFSIAIALCLGLGLGVGGSWYAQHPKQENRSNASLDLDKALRKKQGNTIADEDDSAAPPRFDFYTLLPTMEVDTADGTPPPAATAIATAPTVTETEAEAKLAAAPALPLPKTATDIATSAAPVLSAKQAISPKTSDADLMRLAFIIQAGSFKNQAAAEKLKAKLAFKGVVSKVEPTPNASGETWYRVVIGPLQSQNEAKTLQSRLHADENLNSLVLRVRV